MSFGVRSFLFQKQVIFIFSIDFVSPQQILVQRLVTIYKLLLKIARI